MPSIYSLNAPPNPFWDFVANIEDHPFFANGAQPPNYTQGENADADKAQEKQPTDEMSDTARGKQATVEDPPVVDPSTLDEKKDKKEKCHEGRSDMPFRGRGRCGRGGEDDAEGPRRGHGGRGRGGFEGGPYAFRGGRGGPHHHGGPPPFAFGPGDSQHHGGPPPFMFGPRGPWWARRGPSPPGGPHHGPGPHGGPHRGGHPHPHHRGPPGGREGFNLREFLTNLGQRLGIDLSSAADGLGLGQDRPNDAADFEPRADLFDTATAYIVHLSLPGAKKSDVGVDWDGEHSVLRVAGVVHRPNADEELLAHLVVDGRKRETGVFEKAIRLGTRREPASIDVVAISAKMTDGVLVVTVPKLEREKKGTREVPIDGSPAAENREGDLLEGDEIEMYDAAAVEAAANEKSAIRDDRSETMDFETAEKLPRYEAKDSGEESDWEKDGSEDEGEYVKINVD